MDFYILESPGKKEKVKQYAQKITGRKSEADATYGHLRDMSPKSMAIDFDNNYEPIYSITVAPPGRKYSYKDIIANLKKKAKAAKNVYILTDMDREGEAIAAGVIDLLGLKKYQRLLTNEITEKGIKEALKKPTELDQNMVDAQKARRVLDRLVGFEISPILSKQYHGKYSAGRVQTVVDRLVVEKEEEIDKFFAEGKDATFFRIFGDFGFKAKLHKVEGSYKAPLKGEMAKIEVTGKNKEVIDILKKCLSSEFKVFHTFEKDSFRSPPAPFTTSTLQQEAHRKLGMSLKRTMNAAQKLYEAGCITYMRTDSVKLSKEAIDSLKTVIIDKFGEKYYSGENNYKSKKGAQEGHEPIRPTHPESDHIDILGSDEQRLYSLIWKRSIASQMAKAQIKQIHVQISISKEKEFWFEGLLESVVFPGFMKVYRESLDDQEDEDFFQGKAPKKGDILVPKTIEAKQEYIKPPVRFQQASLVKKLEELGIGRPSTYVNMVQVNFDRGYLETSNIKGIKKPVTIYSLNRSGGKLEHKIYIEENTIELGAESDKIIPTEMGKMVIEFMRANFSSIIDYKFTADLEDQLDLIASGKKVWYKVIDKFYKELKPKVESVKKEVKPVDVTADSKVLGKDKDGNTIYAVRNKYGPVVYREVDGKKQYQNIEKPLSLSTITLKDALKLFNYPKKLGEYEGDSIKLDKGRYGMYISWKKINVSVDKEVSLDEAIKLIEEKSKTEIGEKKVKVNGKLIIVKIKKGPYGFYIQIPSGKSKPKFIGLPEGKDEKITDEEIVELIKNPPKKFKKGNGKK